MDSKSNWMAAEDVWSAFARDHPILNFPIGRWGLVNFLRSRRCPDDPTPCREFLIRADVIRRARGRFWVAHKERFAPVAFDLSTGVIPADCIESAPNWVEAGCQAPVCHVGEVA